MTTEELATVIFEWFDRENEGDDKIAYTFNRDKPNFLISVDGEVDCRKLAEAILRITDG